MRKILIPIWIFTLGLTLDLYTKKIANNHLSYGNDIIIFKKLKLRLVKNKGAMLNSFSNHRRFLLSINIIIFIFLLNFFKNSYIENNLINLIGISIVLSGGVGNNYERITKKEVTDFLYFDYKNLPIFNFADFLIYIGILTLLFNNRHEN